jgi:uncharacterized membrane-anchored protein
MSGSFTLIVLVGVFGLLVGVAYILDRRYKKKGEWLAGEESPLWKGNRLTFYLSFLLMIVGAGIFLKGFIDQSTIVMIVGAVVGGGAIAYRYYVQLKK